MTSLTIITLSGVRFEILAEIQLLTDLNIIELKEIDLRMLEKQAICYYKIEV